MATTITLRAKEEQKELIAQYAKVHGKTISGFMLEAALDKIEDELDLHDMEVAMREFEKNPITHPWSEVKERLGL